MPSFARVTLTQATGTAPFTITSTTKVQNLNSDLLDGYHESDFPVSKRGGDIRNPATLDAKKRNGMYRVDSGCSAAPRNDRYYSLIVYGNENNVVNQVASDFQTGETYIRAFNNS